jgi:hypothetical protein
MASFQPHHHAGRRRRFRLRLPGLHRNGSGGFGSHLINLKELEHQCQHPAATSEIARASPDPTRLLLVKGPNSSLRSDFTSQPSFIGRRYSLSPYPHWKMTWMIYFNSDSDRSSRCNIDIPQLLRLREDARRPTNDYFDYLSRLEN